MNSSLAHRRLGALWRFAVSAGIWYGAQYFAEAIASPLYLHHWRGFEVIFRCVFLGLLLGGFSLLIVAADSYEGSPLAYMGLTSRVPWLRDSVLGALIGAVMVALAAAVIALVGGISFSLTIGWRPFGRLALEIVILLAGAMAEEVSFRGYPFQRMVDAIGAAPAVILLSVLFGAIHWSNPGSSAFSTLNTALVGILLCLAYLRTRALWLPWGIHFGWNFALGVGFGLPVSGLNEFAVLIHGKARGPHWLTGGTYGIEASATGTAVMLIGLAVVIGLTRGRHRQEQDVPATPDSAELTPSSPRSPSDLASNQEVR